ncbi:MAG: prenyltransferase [Hyalangium sp.]|uniref:prenyltransferase n=1 Tax=Hyalangium sp. TaxID=2028555 RepID=UPI003899BDB5
MSDLPLPVHGKELVVAATAGSSRRSFLAHFVRLGRTKYLLYSWVLHSLGVTAAVYMGSAPQLGAYLHGQLFVWCLHLMTHYCNEYFDLEADRANPSPTQWTGGSRVLVEGLIEPKVSLIASLVLLCVCLALIPSMPRPAQYAAIIGLGLAWFYTAPPFQLNYRGLGELTVTTVLNGCFPMIGYALATGEASLFPALLLLPAFLIQFVRMTIMNLLDYEGDRRVGKRTLVVLLGPRAVLHLHAVVQALAYVLLVPAVLWGRVPLWVALCVGSTLPLSAWHVARLYRGAHLNPRTANSVPFWASTHVSLVVAAAYIGLLLDGFLRGIFRVGGPSNLLLAPIVVYAVILLRQMRKNRPKPIGEPRDAAAPARAA